MPTLRVIDSLLADLSATLSGGAAQLSLSDWIFRWPEGALQSDSVAAALHDTTSQQIERSDLVARALTTLGDFPAAVAEQFRATDSLLGRELN
ncbi:hypothetical protein [Cryobacterium sp. Y11]|uniref:hypothetical protein n=1 Tax=Cryobacterium sp. Y11 TaxID=2045016 RepID=UPI000CE508CD|nr:hypothetical protein [Cryobacterium sp. Y11]